MPSLVILGASGFLGRAIISHGNSIFPIKAIARRIPLDVDLCADSISWCEADLLIPHSLNKVLESGDIVINLVYMRSDCANDNLCVINNIIDSCIRNKVARLIHCSTAVVAGATKDFCVDETTACLPLTQYERVKFAIEQLVLSAVSQGLDIAILRPTAIVGPNGENLNKLANSLINGNSLVNYFRAALFGRRKMNLVPVRNVAAAMMHLAFQQDPRRGEIYIISSDNDPSNNFLSVESIVLSALGRRSRKLPVLHFPQLILSVLLRLRGRSASNVARIYDCKKLLATNFVPLDSVSDAIMDWGQVLSNRKKTDKEI